MGNIISWLFKEEPVRFFPFADRVIIILMRGAYIGSYLLLRLLLRLLIGKERRNDLLVKMDIHFNYEFDVVPAIHLFGLFHLITKCLRNNNHFLLKITVPKYDYKVYCPTNKNDLINLTIREDEIIERFHPEEGDIVVDVGAHYGRYTLIASKRVGPKGRVISIEADPENFEMLNGNIKLNKLTNVACLNYAAYSKEAKLRLHLPKSGMGHTIYNTVMPNRFESKKFIEVEANTLDHLLQLNLVNLEQINWIKIDVEGAELEVLKGATDILTNSHNISLLIEIHRLLGDVTLHESIVKFLRSYNFKIQYEKIHEGGERHIIAEKQQRKD